MDIRDAISTYHNRQIDKSLLCPICKDPFIDPVETDSCGHTYCRQCIYRWLDRNLSCPLDKSPLQKTALKRVNKIIESQLNELLVECKLCQQTFQRGLLPLHLEKSCPATLSKNSKSPTEMKILSPISQLNSDPETNLSQNNFPSSDMQPT
eukprot:Sdes_comp12921_c0_seq1m3029